MDAAFERRCPVPRHRAAAPVPRLPIHADCDVAALVYGPGDDPDPLLGRFFERRLGQGHDVVGVLQERRPAEDAVRREARVRLLADPDWRPPVLLSHGCAARTGDLLAAMGRHLAVAIDRRPDVLVLNRFGMREVSGGGLWNVLHGAVVAELPVVVAVPEALFPVWLRATGGLAVRVTPDEDGLERWWRSLGHGPALPPPRPGPCELYK